MTTSNFEFRESLEEMSLSEMFANIDRHKVPGLFEITRESVVKRVYLRDGFIVHATSTDPKDRLGALLYRAGALDRAQLEETLRQHRESGQRLGQVLIDQGLIAPDSLYQAIRSQTEEIVWSVFSWQTGEVTFRIGEFNDPLRIQVHLPIRQAIIQGVKKVPDTKALVERLGTKTSIYRPTFCIEDLIGAALSADEYLLLRAVDGQRSLYELCTSGPFSVSENARLLYAFRILRLIERIPDQEGGSSGVKIRLSADSSVVSTPVIPTTDSKNTEQD